MPTLPQEIFKAYDIRGIVGKTLTPDIVRSVGQGLGTLALEAGCDTLVIGCDGVNSSVRERFAAEFQSTIDWRPNRFSWLGADFALPAFTFIFEPTPHGLFQVHAYPFAPGRSTWIVECSE